MEWDSRENNVLQQFLELIDAPVPTGVVHVGAHHGQEIDEYIDYEPDIIVWIEADPLAYEQLHKFLSFRHNEKIPQWCINALISDVDGMEQDFYIAKNQGQSSSMFPSSDLFMRRYPHGAPTGEVLKLQTKTLQTALSGLDIEPSQIDYLVLDTQGAEMKCLNGVGPYIENIRYMTLEVSTAEYYEGGAQMHQLDDFLGPHGFLRVSSDPEAFNHGNAFYVRMDQNSPSPGNQLDDADQQVRDGDMRIAFNDIIVKINNYKKEHVGREIVDEIVALQEEYGDLLQLPGSRDLCLGMTRFAFDEGLKEVFPFFFRPLGWK